MHLDRLVHDAYFTPLHEEFAPRTMWSLQNAFTETFKALEAVPKFRSTAPLGEFFRALS